MLYLGFLNSLKFILVCFLSLPLIVVSFDASADVEWSLGVEMGALNISDPDGDVDLIFTPAIFGGGAYKIDRTSAVKGGLFYLSTSGEGSNDSVGQNFTAYGLTVEYQKKIVLTRDFKPLLSAGVVISQEKATERYLEDDYGYLLTAYPDDSRVGFGISLSAAYDFTVYKENFDVGVKYVQGFDSLGFSTVFVTYKF